MSVIGKNYIGTNSSLFEPIQLQIGSGIGQWTITKRLGVGGFGAVYTVVNKDGKEYAMKIEKANGEVKVLKMEYYVLTKLKEAKATHFCDILDNGRVKDINYLVMTLVGDSLQDLRKAIDNPVVQKFTLGCALSVGIKCLEAIEELHGIGYLHRDIKPGNFTIGRDDPRRIFLIDFGMCRRYLDKDGNVRKPRWSAGFRGTIRYAPLSCHISREQARKDDLETWIYMQVEITKGRLPWKFLETKEDVGRYKEKCRTTGLKELFGGCPREFITILQYVDSIRYFETPDYKKIKDLMRVAIVHSNVKEYPYDWEKNKN